MSVVTDTTTPSNLDGFLLVIHICWDTIQTRTRKCHDQVCFFHIPSTLLTLAMREVTCIFTGH